MNDLQIFNHPDFGEVRTVTINDEPWFVGKDVAQVLGYAKTENALAAHVDGDDTLKHCRRDRTVPFRPAWPQNPEWRT